MASITGFITMKFDFQLYDNTSASVVTQAADTQLFILPFRLVDKWQRQSDKRDTITALGSGL